MVGGGGLYFGDGLVGGVLGVGMRFLVGVLVLGVVLAGCQRSAPVTASVTPSVAGSATVGATGSAVLPQASPSRVAATPGSPVVASAVPSGEVCAFAPPFGGTPVARPAATATATVVQGGQPTQRPVAPRPGQDPPSVPLPNLAARYALTVDRFTFGASRSEFRVAETVVVTNREGCALDRLTFNVTAARWGWLALDGVRVGGQAVAARVEGVVLAVALPQRLAPGASVEVAFDFRMSVGAPLDNYTLGGFAGTLQAGEILRLAYWFPILSDDHQYPPFLDPPYTANADYEATLTLPSNLVVAHTGVASEQRKNADGTTTYRIRAENVRDFVIGMSPNYQVERRTAANGVVVELYYDPKSINPNGRRPDLVQGQVGAALDAAVLAVARLGALIGPYPYPVLRLVDGGPTLLGGIEFPMLVAINLSLPGVENLVYHEVAHEWLYGIIGTRTQQDPWIDEGGVTFLADYLGGTLNPSPPGASGFNYRLDSSVWTVAPAGFQSQAIESIYTQGGAFYTRVMRAMGEEAFWRAMQRLYREFRFGIVTPRDVLGVWQAESAVDLRPLFAEYFDYPWVGELGR